MWEMQAGGFLPDEWDDDEYSITDVE